eukprot:Hpha_TRINITY_DN23094_c0_g1::TRINITY_DN23094_c0_g1_i1::g.109450::m.109450
MDSFRRQRTLKGFREGSSRVLVSTDLLSRGLDIQGIAVVVNFDFPPTIAGYVHRIGRSARGEGAVGEAISFITRSSQALAGDLAGVLEDTGQPVPPELLAMLPRGTVPNRKRSAAPLLEHRSEGPAVAACAKRQRVEKKEPPPDSKSPSSVVLLRNMVRPGEVDEELEGDVREECSRFGKVLEVAIYEQQRWSGLQRVPEELAVRVLVSFASPEEALRCWKVMNGRQFGGRTVLAGFYPKSRFDAGDFSPDAETDPEPPRCILLRNMVLPWEVDDELIPETVEELSHFGEVQSCEVHLAPDTPEYKHLANEERVRVFARFGSTQSAIAALVNLDGRMFANKEMNAVLFDDARYSRSDFLPDDSAEPELPLRCLISTTALPE